MLTGEGIAAYAADVPELLVGPEEGISEGFEVATAQKTHSTILQKVRTSRNACVTNAKDKSASHADRRPSDIFALRRLSRRHSSQMEQLLPLVNGIQNHSLQDLKHVERFFEQKGKERDHAKKKEDR
jgi:hypothetical protein